MQETNILMNRLTWHSLSFTTFYLFIFFYLFYSEFLQYRIFFLSVFFCIMKIEYIFYFRIIGFWHYFHANWRHLQCNYMHNSNVSLGYFCHENNVTMQKNLNGFKNRLNFLQTRYYVIYFTWFGGDFIIFMQQFWVTSTYVLWLCSF